MTVLATRPGGLPARPAPGPAGVRRPEHPALVALLDAGLLSGTDAAAAQVRDLSRAHPVWGVSASGRSFVVKAPATDRGFDLGIEFLVYRMARWCEPLRAALPDAVHVDEDRHVVVLADLGADSLAVRAGFPPQLGMPPTPCDPAWLSQAVAGLGATLGAVHRGTAGLPLPPARPPLAIAGFAATSSGPIGDACAPLAADPVFGDAARALSGPVSGCLVSHDMKWDNVVPHDGGVALLDWELAGSGDPAIDLGFLLAEHLLRDGVEGLGPDARTLLRSYADAAALRADIVGVLARRTATAAGLRIAQLSIEVADGFHAEARDALVDLARAALLANDELTEEVTGCLH